MRRPFGDYVEGLSIYGNDTPGEFREIRIRWNLDKDLPLFKPRYNIAPGKEVPVIVREASVIR